MLYLSDDWVLVTLAVAMMFAGAFTTALGMLPLVWAPFETGRVFLKLFALIIFLGVLHAFVCLPVL